jgi:hypothetical protein
MTDQEARSGVVNEGVMNTGPGTVNITGSSIGRQPHVTAPPGSEMPGGIPTDRTFADASGAEPATASGTAELASNLPSASPGRRARRTDRHSGTFLAASAVVIAAGGIFMAVVAAEPANTPRPVWANAWFDVGFAFVILGLMIGAAGLYQHFYRELPTAGKSDEGTSQATTRPRSSPQGPRA